MAIAFAKSSLSGLRYTPPGITAITATATSGERYAFFRGLPTGDLRRNGVAALLVCPQLVGLTNSAEALADSSDTKITTANGFMWQWLMRGGNLIAAQVTATVNGATYTGEGCYEPPGTAGGWESLSTNDAVAEKDMAYLIGHARLNAATFDASPQGIGIYGSSGASIISCHNVFGPNLANNWGAGAQHDQSTRPNFMVSQHTVLVSSKPFDQAATGNAMANHFESVATPGTLADAMNDVPAAYLRAYELVNRCPFWGTGRGLPIFCSGDQSHVSVRFGEPFEAGVINPGGGGGHSMWGSMALKARFRGSSYVTLASGISKSGLTLGSDYDAVLDDINAAGVAGETTGAAIDWAVAHAFEPERVLQKGEMWSYSGAVLTTGYFAIPRNMTGRIRTLRVTCTHATNAIRFGLSQDRATQYAFPTGIPVEVRTAGPLWIKSNEATASSYAVEEYE